MEFTLGLAQCRYPKGYAWEDAAELVERWCARARDAQVDLLVFPESLMTRYSRKHHAFLEAPQTLDGPFCCSVDALAVRYGMWIAYTLNEVNYQGEDGGGAATREGKPFNTAVLVDGKGVRRGSYRKAHLFDSRFTQESSRMAPGDGLFEPVSTPFGTIGLAICYDLRFPEVARYEALRGCDLFVLPAAWVEGDGPRKAEQWKTLLAARAIENQMFVAGATLAGEGLIGQSCVFGPDGSLLAGAGRDEELVVARIDTSGLAALRAATPVFSHRRPALYS